MSHQGHSFAVIGLGMFGGTIATALAAFGDEVRFLGLTRGTEYHDCRTRPHRFRG